ncbi:MAG: M56 family metallopeptidase [Flavobacteriaceae bacterium]
MDYLLKASALIFIFYLIYRLLLRHDTFFNLNRWFLLLGLLVAFALPFVVIPVYIAYTPVSPTGIEITNASPQPEPSRFNPLSFLPYAYGLGILFFTGRFLVQSVALANLLTRYKKHKKNGFVFVETNEQVSPFSFFKYLVYNPNNFSKTELNQILAHEKAHALQRHSVDNIIAQLSCIVLWFNPFIWLYAKSLKQNLEFIADRKATSLLSCKKQYQYTLLKTSLPFHHAALSNPFYNSLIKKRIVMLHKPKSRNINLLKFALVVPALALFLMSFNTQEVYIETPNNTHKAAAQSPNLVIVFTKDLTDTDLEGIKQTLEKEGLVFTYSNLKRNNTGEITSLSVKVEDSKGRVTANAHKNASGTINPFLFHKSDKEFGVKNINTETDKEWETKFIVGKPFKTDTLTVNNHVKNITFTQSGNKIEADSIFFNKTPQKTEWNIAIGKANDPTSSNSIKTTKPPLYILDGRKISANEMENIKKETIASVSVLKNENATTLYGDEVKNGVVIITTKKNPTSPWTVTSHRNKNIIYASKDTIYVNDKPNILLETINSFERTPLLILDGKETTKRKALSLNEGTIQSITTTKGGKKSIEEYGKKAKNGVVSIKTGPKGTKRPFVKKVEADLYIVVDGKETTKEEIENLLPENIEHINVLKDEKATEKYGKKAKNGVIEITTKAK